MKNAKKSITVKKTPTKGTVIAVVAVILIGFAVTMFGSNGEAEDYIPDSSSEIEPVDSKEMSEVKQEEKLIFELLAGEQGEYGEMVTFNKGTDGEITRCIYHIPAGTYRVTNIGEYMSQINIYSDDIHKTEEGWEEPSETFGCELLDVNKSVIITVDDSQNIYIAEPSCFKFEEQ